MERGQLGPDRVALYAPMVPYIADMIGPHCEVLLQDLRRPENAVVAVRHGYISGISVGDELTREARNYMEKRAFSKETYQLHGPYQTDKGEAALSSIYPICDDEGVLIGLLCVHILRQALAPIAVPSHTDAGRPNINAMDKDELKQYIVDAIQEVLPMEYVGMGKLSKQEKQQIIDHLKEKGIFDIKGAIGYAGILLGMANSTIYRYIKRSEK